LACLTRLNHIQAWLSRAFADAMGGSGGHDEPDALIAVLGLPRLPDARAVIRVAGLSALAMLLAQIFAVNLPEFSLFMRDNLTDANAMTSGRLDLWHNTFMRWLDAPLFGWGVRLNLLGNPLVPYPAP